MEAVNLLRGQNIDIVEFIKHLKDTKELKSNNDLFTKLVDMNLFRPDLGTLLGKNY